MERYIIDAEMKLSSLQPSGNTSSHEGKARANAPDSDRQMVVGKISEKLFCSGKSLKLKLNFFCIIS